ncbi:hypothetical protein L227DRAFT_381872 [Lentinus tigrinus ALCF2SS1-6]|uniref:Uncharacterized protein n=1 Tax=Lentinus tigrinus ALCF2SS1-6 TaxID=1328759 RepID=A0A5C2RQ11_9APHY|nr:hypothetical protein L227DRAFT_381872 [Lentinus tigrinus ALCF2SS1-6]
MVDEGGSRLPSPKSQVPKFLPLGPRGESTGCSESALDSSWRDLKPGGYRTSAGPSSWGVPLQCHKGEGSESTGYLPVTSDQCPPLHTYTYPTGATSRSGLASTGLEGNSEGHLRSRSRQAEVTRNQALSRRWVAGGPYYIGSQWLASVAVGTSREPELHS